MPARPGDSNIFIVQTPESSHNRRSKGTHLSIINKQSALYKYRQQKKKKENPVSSERKEVPPTFEVHRSSWLLESRLPGASTGESARRTRSRRLDEINQHRRILVAGKYGDPAESDSDSQLHDCYAGLRTDPFGCMPIKDSSLVLGVSDLYTNMIIPHVSQLARVFNIQDVYLDIFWSMIFHEDTIDAVVAMSYCADAGWRKSTGAPPRKDLFHHHGKSLASLRRRCSNSKAANDGVTICMLMYNCNIARFLGNMQAAKQHMAMIRQLLRQNVSIDSLGFQGKLKPLLLQWEYWLTLSGDEEPLVPRGERPKSVYPSLPLHGEVAILVGTLPEPLQILARQGCLSYHVLQVLGRTQEMVTALEAGRIRNFLETPNKDPYPDNCSAVPCLDAADGGEAGLERLLVCALFLLTSRLLSPTKQALWSLPTTGGRTILTKQLFNCLVDSNAEKECLIWTWMIAIDSWAVASGGFPDTARDLMQRLMARYPETSDWSYVSKVAKRFFWNHDLDTACEGYWEIL